MKTFGKIFLGVTFAITVPVAIAGTVFTAQHPQQVKTWFSSGFQNTENCTADTENNAQIESLQNQIESYKQEIESYKKQIEELEVSYTNKLSTAQSEAQEYKTKYDECQSVILEIQSKIEGCQNQIVTLQQQKSELEESNQYNVEQIAACEAQITELQDEISSLNNALTSNNLMMTYYKNEYNKAQSRVEELLASNSALTEQTTQLQSQIESYQNQIVFLEATIDSLMEQLEQSSSETAEEIIDYKFVGNTLAAYTGTETDLSSLTLPSSYSLEVLSSGEETTLSSIEEFSSFLGENSSASFFIQFNGEEKMYVTPFSLGAFMGFFDEETVVAMFPATVQIAECKFVTGDDYQVTGVSGYAFEAVEKAELHLPPCIDRVGVGVFDDIQTLYITNTEKVVVFFSDTGHSISAKESQIYVPSTLLEEYKSTYPQMANNFVGV